MRVLRPGRDRMGRRWRRWSTGIHLLHRVSGPAVEHDNGEKWWFVGGRVLYHEGYFMSDKMAPDGNLCANYSGAYLEYDQGKKMFMAPGYGKTPDGEPPMTTPSLEDKPWSPC